MAVTPLVPQYRLQLSYKPAITHKQQLLVDAVLSGGSYSLVAHDSSSVAIATFVSQYAALLKPFYDSTTTFDSWILQKFVSGAYIEVDTGTIGVAGTASGAPNPTSLMSWVFVSGGFKRVKFVNLGANAVDQPAKNTFAVLGTRALNYVSDILNNSSGHIGYVMRGRDGQPLTRFIDEVEDYSRTSRKRLGDV